MDGTVVVTCAGRRCRAVGPPPAGDTTVLREAVRETPGAVLVRSAGCLGPCAWAPVALIAPRTDTGDQFLAVTMLGPLSRASQVGALAGWVRDGGPLRAPLPPPLRDLTVRP